MIPVYVLSLKSATARRAAIVRQLDSLGVAYKIVDGVDGEALDLSHLPLPIDDKKFKEQHGGGFAKSEIGCYLSHYNMWRLVAEQEIPYAVILEDDAILEDDFLEVVNALPTIGWRWDLVRLSSHTVARRFARKKYRVPPSIHHKEAWRFVGHKLSPIGRGRFLVRHKKPTVDTVGYVLSCHAARVLVSHGSVMRQQVDIFYEQPWIHNLHFLGVHFPVVSQPPPHPDDSLNELDRQERKAFKIRHDNGVLKRIRRWGIRKSRKMQLQWWNFTHPPEKL